MTKKTAEIEPKSKVKARAFDEERTKKILNTLVDYKAGKTSIDQKATDNQEWWRLRHWNVLADTNEGKKDNETVGSAWAVNSILNKHADIMDSFPKPNVLPREADDEEEADLLSRILPTIEEQNNAEQVFSRAGYDFLIDGTAVTGVFWDNLKHDGLGDIVKTNVDIHNVFWQPGIDDIQDSKYFFNVALADVDDVKEMYPEYADKIGATGYDSGIMTKYIHDDTIDTTSDVEIIDCYYKKLIIKRVELPQEGGRVLVHNIPQTQVHLATIVGGTCVFSSEDEQGYEDGFYSHGQYPFVFRTLFPIKDSPCGFGYLDIMKNPQRDIDKLDQAIISNTMQKARSRWWIKKNADIDKEDFADWDVQMVEVGSGNLGDAVKQMDVDTIPGIVVTHLNNKIDELKETSGNRDFSQGGTSGGVTAASAIAALQEAGSKLSRDVNKTLYRAAKLEYELEIELIRQFYKEDRTFRVDNNQGGYEFIKYSSNGTSPQQEENSFRRSIFDIKISAEKASPFSRAAQNETAKELYQLGLFAPGNAGPALICLDMMDFEGKDKIKAAIQSNDMQQQQFQQMAQALVQGMPQVAAQLGLIAPEEAMQRSSAMQGQQQGQSKANILGEGTAEERAANKTTNNERQAR